jgi:hypothetical protein
MKKLIIFITFSTFYQFSFCQKTIVSTYLHFTGNIDKYPIEMTLCLDQGNDSILYSTYFYSKYRETIRLKGTLIGNEVNLSEQIFDTKEEYYRVNGYFILKFDGFNKLTGTWQNEKRDKELSVELACRENLIKFNPQKFRYKLNIYKGKSESYIGEMREYDKINKLQIQDVKNKLIQNLTGFDEIISNKNGEIELEDINFDGFLDLKIPIYFPNLIKYDHSFLYYIYNAKLGKFIRNESLESLGYLSFDAVAKEIIDVEADGSGNESETYYKWYNGDFYLIREEKRYEESYDIFITEYQIINGKSVMVKEYKKE